MQIILWEFQSLQILSIIIKLFEYDFYIFTVNIINLASGGKIHIYIK